jgi:DNA-binding transcriptional MocR family regulator
MTFAADPHGHHLWLWLPDHWRAADFAEHADRVGISIVPSSTFATSTRPLEAVRISLGVAPDRGALEDGLTLLASLIAQPSVSTRAVV